MQKLKYKNVTLSGLPGAGATTLLNMLKEELKFEGWKGFSGGEFMRAYAIEKGLFDKNNSLHHDPTIYGDDFDRKVDFGIREKVSEEENWIIESKLSGFMAQGIPQVLKVLVICSHFDVRIDRIVNRDGVTPEEAKNNFEERLEVYHDKWIRMYSKEWQEWVVASGKATQEEQIDFWKENLYDIVIDTYSTSKTETLNIVLNEI